MKEPVIGWHYHPPGQVSERGYYLVVLGEDTPDERTLTVYEDEVWWLHLATHQMKEGGES